MTKLTRVALTVLASAGLALTLTACGSQNGKIVEVEEGRNGVKVEVKDGAGSYEAYLIPGTTCRENDFIQDCADEDDYLVAPSGAKPGLNGGKR